MSKDYEVVISGVSGKFPECLNFQELEDNLYTNESLVNNINSKWKPTKVTNHTGNMKDQDKFDDLFFGVSRKLASQMDPHTKCGLERAFEAILDSGRNPSEFFGSNTSVLVASSTNDTEAEFTASEMKGFTLLGSTRSMQSNRISYTLHFTGPSYTIIGSWDSPLQALAKAHSLVQKGFVKQALVGASNLLFYQQVSHQYQGLRKLNNDGIIKSFSAEADGYSRSDGVVMFFIQRAEDAIRSYGSIVKVLQRTQMDNKNGITEPTGFTKFLTDFYSDLTINKDDIAFVEGDGCAILRTDAEEVDGLAQVLCSGRTKPLPLTCCKPKIGHCEGASGFVSLASALIAMKTGYIPPVLNFTKPNPLVPALNNGTIKVVTEKTPIEGEYVAVTCIGLLSSFGHILLKRNPVTRKHALDTNSFPSDGVPRLFLLSGRDEDPMKVVLKKIEDAPIDDGLYRLDHMVYRKEIPKHLYRGFSVKAKKETSSSQVVSFSGGAKRPIWFIFSGMGSQWSGMGKSIMEIPVIKRSIERCHKALLPKGLDLISIFTSSDPKIYDNILHSFVGIAAIQVALVDLLEELGVKADGMVGHSVGELGCAYADKGITTEQIMLAAWARGSASNEVPLIEGLMAAVGRGYKDIINNLPEGIEAVCHNSDSSCTLSGPTALMEEYVSQLKSRGIFAKLVNASNIAYHSKYITPLGPIFLERLKQIIPEPKLRSSRWISSSIPEVNWNSELARYSSAEYHTNNLLSYVLFEEATKHVPKDAICIEIAPHGLLQAIIKKSMSDCTHISITNRGQESSFFTINALGMLFCHGVDMDVSKLYPPLGFPVPRETSYLHPVFCWNHSQSWKLNLVEILEKASKFQSNEPINLFSHSEEVYSYIQNHKMAGRPHLPPAKFLCLLMDYVTAHFKSWNTLTSYHFKHIMFMKPLSVERQVDKMLEIQYQGGTGKFEMILEDTCYLKGTMVPMTHFPDPVFSHNFTHFMNKCDGILMDQESVYRFFEENGCTLSQMYRNICDVLISETGFIAKVKWQGSSELYLDAILKLIILYSSVTEDTLMDISSIAEFIYDPSLMSKEDKDVVVYYDVLLGQLTAEGVRLNMFKTRVADFLFIKTQVQKPKFLPFSDIQTENEFLEVCLQMVHEAANDQSIKIVCVGKSKTLNCLLQNQYFKNLIKSKMNIKLIQCNDESDMPEFQPGLYLFLTDDKLKESLVKAIDSSKNDCYLVQSASLKNTNCITKFKTLEPVLDHSFNTNKLIFYKKTINVTRDANFVHVPNGHLNETSTQEKLGFSKAIFFILKYNNLSDIATLLKENETFLHMKCSRFVFLDDTQSFDPTNDFYLKELKKDAKISVCHKGVWGCLRTDSVFVPNLKFSESLMPLKTIRCPSISVKAIGLNLQNMVVSSPDDKFVLADYCGVSKKDNKEVMGLAVLNEDYLLETDDVLVWNKPASWTYSQAATIPLFFSLAYYMLRNKFMYQYSPGRGILVHGGHSVFSQAVIRVALGIKATIFTTCFTMQQKKFIQKQFPQVDESHIILLEGNIKDSLNKILSVTERCQMYAIVDSLNNEELRRISLECLSYRTYYVLNHDQPSSQIGMGIFLKNVCVAGINAELMLDMSCDKKKILADLVQKGIEKGEVVPLDYLVMDPNTTSQKAKESLVEVSQLPTEGKKVVVITEQEAGLKKSIQTNQINGKDTKKVSIIIGVHDLVWYDMIKWLIFKGSNTIYIFTDWNSVPSDVHFRLKRFMKRHSSVTIHFMGIEHLHSPAKLRNILQKIGLFLDKTFYIVPGMEKELELVDQCLRELSKDSCLVCVGGSHQNTQIIEQRRIKGFKGISFILKRRNMRNISIIHSLDDCIKESHQEQEHLILIDELFQDEEISEDDSETLPRTLEELVELGKEPCNVTTHLNEMSTMCYRYEYSRELDPVIFFPGFKLTELKRFVSRILYPSFLVTYPDYKTSFDVTASLITQELIKRFDLEMFTLVGEGWASPLVIQVARLLEANGKICSIILLDPSANMIGKSPKIIKNSDNIIAKTLEALNQSKVQLKDLKNWRDRLVENMIEDNTIHSHDEVARGLDTVITRLGWATSTKTLNHKLRSKVHLLTTSNALAMTMEQVTTINKMCVNDCSLHIIELGTGLSLLEGKEAIDTVNNLTLLEYKHIATKQNVHEISSSKIIYFEDGYQLFL